MFSCVWLHFKTCFGKYFLMFGCVLENTIENTFSTCLLIFSHIFSVTKRIYNIIHFSKHKQKPRKKSSNPDKYRSIAIGALRRRVCGAGDVFFRIHDLFFLSPSLFLSLSSIFQGRKSFEVKMEIEMIFRCFGSKIRSTGNAFQFDRI